MKIKISIIALILILSITGYVNAVAASLQAPATITTESNQFVVKLNINEKISGINFTIKYDEEEIEFIDVQGSGGKAINNQEAGKAIVAFVSTTDTETPYSIIFKALDKNKRTKIIVEDISVVVTDTASEYGVREEELGDTSITVKPSELTEAENLELDEIVVVPGSPEQELLDEASKLEIIRPDPNTSETSSISLNAIIIYAVVAIVVIVLIVILLKAIKKKKE